MHEALKDLKVDIEGTRDILSAYRGKNKESLQISLESISEIYDDILHDEQHLTEDELVRECEMVKNNLDNIHELMLKDKLGWKTITTDASTMAYPEPYITVDSSPTGVSFEPSIYLRKFGDLESKPKKPNKPLFEFVVTIYSLLKFIFTECSDYIAEPLSTDPKVYDHNQDIIQQKIVYTITRIKNVLSESLIDLTTEQSIYINEFIDRLYRFDYKPKILYLCIDNITMYNAILDVCGKKNIRIGEEIKQVKTDSFKDAYLSDLCFEFIYIPCENLMIVDGELVPYSRKVDSYKKLKRNIQTFFEYTSTLSTSSPESNEKKVTLNGTELNKNIFESIIEMSTEQLLDIVETETLIENLDVV
jgi:hypothetical protein